MKANLLAFLLILLTGFTSTAQLITFDDQGHANGQNFGTTYGITNNGETFNFSLPGGGSTNLTYRTTDGLGCGNTGHSHLTPSGFTVTPSLAMETASGNEINLGTIRFDNVYACFSFSYNLIIEGFKDGASTGTQVFTVSGMNATFSSNANFDDVDRIVITSTGGDIANLGIDNINWVTNVVPCTEPAIPSVTATQPICAGSSTTLNIAGSLGDATQWHIYTGFCGVTQVGTTAGSTFVVSPTSTTSYFIRGEGGCTTPGTCGAVSVTVNAAENASFSYSTSVYCVNDADPTPTITGVGGGNFVATTPGLSMNATTGAIDVSASIPGAYTIEYTTPGTCSGTSDVSVTINALDDATFAYSTASYCTNDADPTPTITGLPGGSFSSGAGLSINAGSGIIDVSASIPGSYTVTYTTTGTCPNGSNVSVTINALDDASFNYSAASYCVNAGDPTPTITGLPGGSYSSGAGLSINAGTGTLDVSASIPGVYTVTYTTTGSCPNSSNVSVTINALDDATFAYGAAAYCVNDIDPTPTLTGLAGGTFSSTVGLSINASTGVVDVSASIPGTYLITYTTAGACPNSSAVNLAVNGLDDASFSYSATAFCVNDIDPTPTITGLAGGTFSSGAGLSINASTGTIDVSISTSGAYIVTYTTSGSCPNSSNVSVTVNALDDASFSYAGGAYCVDATDPTPSITGLAGGTFISGPGLSINSGTGTIDVSTSTPGAYTVTYNTSGTCPNSASVSVTVNALDDASFSYLLPEFCQTDSDGTPTITGVAGGTFSSAPVGMSINSTTGVVDVSASSVGTYTITYTTSGTCPNSANVGMVIYPADDASFGYSASAYCTNDIDPTPTITGAAGGSFLFSPAGLSINATTGVIDVSTSSLGTYTVTYLTNGTYATTGTCAHFQNETVTINSIDDASFSYASASYCANGTDPTPTISGVAGGTFTSTAGLLINASTGVLDLSASTAGIYTVTYTTVGACSNSSTESVTVNAIPSAPTTVTPITVCPGADVILSATGSETGNIIFYDGSLTQIASIPMPPATATFNAGALADGTYMFSATEENGGCESTPVTINVTVGDITAPTAVCQDVTIFLNGSGSASIAASDIDGGSTDDCGAVTFSASQTTFDCTNIFGAPANNLVITAAYDAGLSGGTPKGIELFVLADIADLSNYGIGSANNGGGTDGEEFTFPAVAVSAGTFIYVASESTQFTNFFGFAPDYTDGSMGINGDDAVELFFGGNVIDIFGDINVDGSGQPWEYQDGWASRNTGTGPDGSAFTLANWSFSGINVFDSQTSNATTPTPMPIGTYAYVAGPGPTPVTLTVTDASGNTATCVANVTVSDTVAPTSVCQDITVFLDGSGTASIIATDLDNGSSDNCGIASMTASPTTFTCAEVGANTVVLTVTDASGNTSTCTSTVTVSDSISPTASCQDVTVFLDGSGTASIVASDVDNGSTDNCTAVTLAASPTTFTCAEVGANTVVLTVTDASGNTSTCTSTVTVFDSTAPTASCQNVTIFLDGTGNASIAAADLDNGSSDNCSIATFSASPSVFTCTEVGTNTVTLTVTDASGNTSSCTSTVTVSDTIAPTADVATLADVTADCEVTSLTDPTATDNCGGMITVTNDATLPITTSGTTVVTWTYTDGNGNSSTQTQNVIITDVTAPTAVCQNISIFLDGSGDVTITATDIDGGSTDNCGAVSLSASTLAFTCADIGTNNVTLTVTDGNSNTDDCIAVVTVIDSISPVVTCPGDQTELASASCDFVLPDYTLMASGSDNCGAVSITQSPADGTVITSNQLITMTADDGNGNTSTCTFTVLLTGAIPPVAACQAVTIYLDAAGNASIVESDIDGGSTATCGGIVLSASQLNFTCADLGTNDVTLTVTDGGGNTDDCIAVVTVEDTIAPIPDVVALDTISVECSTTMLVDPTVTDICGVVTVTNDATFPLSTLGATTVTWTYDDGNGNTSTQTQIVNVIDGSSPLPNSAPLANVTGECSVDVMPTAPTANDACAGLITGVMTSSVTFPVTTPGTTVITWTFDDGNGNVTTQSQNIIVNDVTAPVPDLATLADVNSDCSIAQPTAPTAMDNCSGAITATTPTVFPITAIGTTVIVWEYIDANGNVTTQTQNAINAGVDATATLSSDGATITANTAGATYEWVNCDFNTIIAGETGQSFTPSANGNYSVIVTAGDCSDTSACETVSTVGIDNLSSDLLAVYPNPSLDGYFTVSYEGTIEAIDVVDMLGRVIELPTDLSSGIVNGSELAAGRYMIRVRTEQSIVTTEIVIAQ